MGPLTTEVAGPGLLRTRMRRREHWWALVVVFLVIQIGFLAASFLAAAIPNTGIVSHLRSAVKEGELSPLDYSKGSMGDQVDHYTECIALTIGIGNTGYRGFVRNALADPELGPCDTAIARLSAGRAPNRATGIHRASPHPVSGDFRGPAFQDYFRYWHGYAIVTRPMLALFGVAATRALAALALVASAAWMVMAAGRRLGWWVPVALTVPFVATVDVWDLPGSIPHALSMAVALAGGALVVARTSGDALSWVRWSLVAGCLYGFVDLMTNPPLAWALTAWSVAAVCMHRAEPPRRVAAAGVVATAAWMAGYGGSWAAKWLLDIIVFGWKAFRTQVVHEIAYRAGGSATVRDVMALNLRFWTGPFGHRSMVVGVVLVASVGVLATEVIRRGTGMPRRRGTETTQVLAGFVALAWPAGLTFAWFALVREQSYIQAFFTYRSLGMSLAIVVASALMLGTRTDYHAARSRAEAGEASEVVSEGSLSEPEPLAASPPLVP